MIAMARLRVMTTGVAALLAGGLAVAADPQPAPFVHGDAAVGKTLSDRDCVACHAQRMAGDADRMYLRADRRVHTPQQLMAQIRYCNSQLRTAYFPREEEDVAAYLNSRFYRFKP